MAYSRFRNSWPRLSRQCSCVRRSDSNLRAILILILCRRHRGCFVFGYDRGLRGRIRRDNGRRFTSGATRRWWQCRFTRCRVYRRCRRRLASNGICARRDITLRRRSFRSRWVGKSLGGSGRWLEPTTLPIPCQGHHDNHNDEKQHGDIRATVRRLRLVVFQQVVYVAAGAGAADGLMVRMAALLQAQDREAVDRQLRLTATRGRGGRGLLSPQRKAAHSTKAVLRFVLLAARSAADSCYRFHSTNIPILGSGVDVTVG